MYVVVTRKEGLETDTCSVQSAVNVVKKMMAETGSIQYSLMVIAPTQD